jgi:nicotinic acid mononucleotide adenylyltransferase
MEASVDFEEHLIQVPLVTRPRRSAAQTVGVSLTELETPFSDRLIGKETPRLDISSSTSRKLKEKRK